MAQDTKETIAKMLAEGFKPERISNMLRVDLSFIESVIREPLPFMADKVTQREKEIATVKRNNRRVTKAQRIKQVMRSLGRHERKQGYIAKRKAKPFYVLGERLKAKWEGITVEQVLAKFGNAPTCYLTGLPIDYDRGETYHLEHVKPRSKGGASSLDNMQLAHPMANVIKAEYPLEEFIRLCNLVARKHPLTDL